MWHLQVFACVLAVFHVSEFALACLFMRKEVGWSSWLFSKPYCIAMGLAVVEYCIEAWLLPAFKGPQTQLIAQAGLAIVIAGELIRKAGMLTAKANFTHMIRRYKHPEHQLVTWGMYRFARHPGYLGWYWWAVGTQVLLVNPVCTCIFAYVAWRFFDQRIQVEEQLLANFFPEYEAYAARTPTWIPFIQ